MPEAVAVWEATAAAWATGAWEIASAPAKLKMTVSCAPEKQYGVETNVDDVGARVGSGIVNDCCGVGERRVSSGVSTRKADSDGVRHGSNED